MPLKNLIIESSLEVFLETGGTQPMDDKADKPLYRQLSDFCHMVKCPEYLHTYRLTPTSLWSGFVVGWTDESILRFLKAHAKYPIPPKVMKFVQTMYANYHCVRLVPANERYYEVIVSSSDQATDSATATTVKKWMQDSKVARYIISLRDRYYIPVEKRGDFKADMITHYLPVKDTIGFCEGDALSIRFKAQEYAYRDYQREAIRRFLGTFKAPAASSIAQDDSAAYGAGVIVLPCGAGKTIVGIGVICALQMSTLIITPNTVALRQWIHELSDKTNLSPHQIGEYSGDKKEIKPITVSTYQVLTYRSKKTLSFKHYPLFHKRRWGLIIYDEIHLLPAPVFRTIAGLQSKRRLGLTATLVREDNKEKDVFALIGPKQYEVPWRLLETKSYLAKVFCYEVKVRLSRQASAAYFNEGSNKFRIASENETKLVILDRLLEHFKGMRILIIGQYLSQLTRIAHRLGYPLITGALPNVERQHHYKLFNEGLSNVLIVSKVANFAIDLPNAEVAIQLSGTYGSRQEEAQRLGRIIRPKKQGQGQAYFFTLTTTHSREEHFARHRKRFLMEQGYHYQICYKKNMAKILPVLST